MKRTTLRLAGIVCAALLSGVSAARAVDGVIEINDASIIAAGGYPAVIATPGSYVLTSNLTPPAGADAINVFAGDVTIDLNGFEINGSGAAGNGIVGFATGLTVRNGSVTGFSGTGIAAGPSSKVFQVHVQSNAGTGIIGTRCLIVESTVSGNGTGISADFCKVENNIVEGSGGMGILGFANVIVHNQVQANLGGGIFTPGGSTIQENVIQDNGMFGISDGIFGPPPPPPPAFPQRVNIRGNTINTNGGAGVSLNLPALISDNTVSGNAGSGVVCGSACTLSGNLIDSNNTTLLPASGGAIVGDGGNVTDNSISFNTGFGLNLPATSGYSQNTLNANAPGPDMLLAPVPGPHPTSGLMNLCSGVPGPAPTCL